jgi:flagellar protein FlbD
MIILTRLNDQPFLVNLSSIQYVEAKPDTVIAFNNGERILVQEPVDEVLHRAREFLRSIQTGPAVAAPHE